VQAGESLCGASAAPKADAHTDKQQAWCTASGAGSPPGRQRWRCPRAGASRYRRRRRAPAARAPQSRAGRHHDRPEAQRAGATIAARGSSPCVRSASRAKSTIMIAIFLTMPISSRIREAMRLAFGVGHHQGEQRSDSGGGQGRDDRERLAVAFIEASPEPRRSRSNAPRASAVGCSRFVENRRRCRRSRRDAHGYVNPVHVRSIAASGRAEGFALGRLNAMEVDTDVPV